MSNPTIASLFSCGGMVECGAIAAGYKPIWGVEFDPQKPTLSAAFADCYERNFEAHVIRRTVQEVDWSALQPPDLLWASPVCTRMSRANTKSGETELDIELAGAIARALGTLTPSAFCLENVRAYQKSQSLDLIRDALWNLGYGISEHILDAADYGVPQSRVRLILRAVLGQFPPPLPPPVMKRMGWYEAIADLIPTLPDSRLADWQLERLPSLLKDTLIAGENSSHRSHPTIAESSTPAFSVTASAIGRTRAYLIERSGARSDRTIHVRAAEEPIWTIRAAVGTDQNGNNRNEVINAWVENGRVVSLTPRALARLQSLPDWYVLPTEMKVAGPMIGSGVPSLLAQMVLESLKPLVVDAPQHAMMLGKDFPAPLLATAAGELKPHMKPDSSMQNYNSNAAAASCDERVAMAKSFRVGDRVRVVKCSPALKSQLFNRTGVLTEPKSLPAGVDCLVALDRHRNSTISSFPFKFEQLELEHNGETGICSATDSGEIVEEDFLDLNAPEDPWLFDEVVPDLEILPEPEVSELQKSDSISKDEVAAPTLIPTAQEVDDPEHKEVQVEVVEELSVEEAADRHRLELKVERAFYDAGCALRELRDRRLYRSSHKTFEDYCKNSFGFTRMNASYLIGGANVVDNLTDLSTNRLQILPTKLEQTKPLAQMEPEEQREVWREAVHISDGKVPSGRTIKGIAEKIKEENTTPPPMPYSEGDVVEIRSGSNATLRKHNGCWGIITHVGTWNCTVHISLRNVNVQCKVDHMDKVDPKYTTQIQEVSDRVSRLAQCNLDTAVWAILETLNRQTCFTPTQLELLDWAERHYRIQDHEN